MSAGTERYPALAVEYPVERSGRLAAALLLLHAGCLAILVVWLLQGAGSQRTAVFPAMLLWCVTAALAARFWMLLPVGCLAWDGVTWHLHRTTGAPALLALGDAVVVRLDLQRQMALAFPCAHPTVWLLVEQTREPARWLDVRRAVYSRPNAVRPAPVNPPLPERAP